jgi:hypothetical protein
VVALTVTQNDTTNNKKAVVINNAATENGITLNNTGNGTAFQINSSATTGGGNSVSGIDYSSTTNTSAVPFNFTVNSASFAPSASLGLLSVRQQHASASGRAAYIGQAGSGDALAVINSGSGNSILINTNDFIVKGAFVSIGKSITSNALDVNGTVAATTFSGSGASLTSIPESGVTNLTSDLALKAPLASPTLTGTPAAPTAAQGTNTTQIATTAMVHSEVVLLAPLASPTFTGTVTAATLTTSAAVTHTVANNGNVVALTVTQNDTTNNKKAVVITNASTENALSITNTGNGAAIVIASSATTAGANAVSGLDYSSTTNTSAVPFNLTVNSSSFAPVASLGLLSVRQQHASASGRASYFSSAGSGEAIYVAGGNVGLAAGVNFVLDAGTGTKIATATNQKLGHYGVTPVVQPSAYTQTYSTADKTHANFTSADLTGITSSTTGSALAEPSAAYTQSEMQQNFRRIQDQLNALRADVADLKQLVNSVIDDLQALGLVG